MDELRHGHDFLGAAHDANARRTRWVVWLTAATMVAEIAAGYATGSMALLADGFHMATHAGALGIAALAYAYARRHAASGRYTFGTGKVGELAGFASALILGVVALGIGVESALRLWQPTKVAFGTAALVAGLGLAVNLASALLLSGGGGHHHGHHHGHQGHGHHHGHDHGHGHGHDHGQEGDRAHGHGHAHGHAGGADNNLRSAYLHVLADALTSVLAILALLGGRYLGWAWLDPAMGLVGAAVIARWSLSLMRDTGRVLLDAADPALEAEIRAQVEGPGDATITDLHVWRVGPEAHAAIVSVAGRPGAGEIRARLRPVHEVAHLTVECR